MQIRPELRAKLADSVLEGILSYPCRYRTREGRVVLAERVSAVARSLVERGWKNVSGIDTHDLREVGLEIAKAEYVGGARPTGKFVDVVVLCDATKPEGR